MVVWLMPTKLIRGGFQDGEGADAESFLDECFLIALILGLGKLHAELLQLLTALASPSQFTLTFTSSHDLL